MDWLRGLFLNLARHSIDLWAHGAPGDEEMGAEAGEPSRIFGHRSCVSLISPSPSSVRIEYLNVVSLCLWADLQAAFINHSSPLPSDEDEYRPMSMDNLWSNEFLGSAWNVNERIELNLRWSSS